ncbi:abhydrolase domain-containing protein FAM108C1 [Trichinella spiralis]|uniref:abhydrolase domain-containing protein FAM108C1 n=1 Tax=Trichinella spiralis TaxID=6334 RepID=UPI0001EFC448|nr:abhydrolase domain-containing protein FAM108C1 [Trichinella spiralis]
MNICPALMKFWTLDGFDPNKILSQSDNVVDLENLCTYVGLLSSTLYKIADILSLDVISYDYPSYGFSTGKLSEKHHYRSIQLVYNFMSNKLGIDDQRIIIWGQSLGTVPSVQFLPTGELISKIQKVHHQTLIVHFGKDDIRALKHVVKLSERYPRSRSVKAVVTGSIWLCGHYFLSQQDGSLPPLNPRRLK